MAGWGSPGTSSADSSQTSLPSPISPSKIPQWLRPTRSRSVVAASSKFKISAMAATCLILGYTVTSMLGPSEYAAGWRDSQYNVASAGLLDHAATLENHDKPEKRPGILETPQDREWAAHKEQQSHPSVSGALSDLHHAVSDKFKSWKYFSKSLHQHSPEAENATSQSHGQSAAWASSGESVKDGIKEEDRLGARVRIGKATILFNGNDFWERCVRTHEQHDRLHGYRLHILRHELMDDVWSKPAYILSLLLRELAKPRGERLDWLFWVDSDTIIMNPNIPIEAFLPPPGTDFDNVYLLYSADWNGLNNGVFPIRVNQWAVNLFSAIVSWRHYHPEDPLQFRDQSAMNSLMQEPEFAKHILQAPQRWFNAYQGEVNETLQPFQVRRGDLLVHFAGVFPREERMQFWLERAEQHLAEWEVPFKSTSYAGEAKDFWSDQRSLRKEKAKTLQLAREEAEKLISNLDQNLIQYGDRLDDDQRVKIDQQREALRGVLDREISRDDEAKIQEGITIFSEGITALTGVITNANKKLLQSAHEAIFAGEKDLLEAGGATSSDLEQISMAVANLKTLIMTPEDTWNRQEIVSATNLLTDARGRLQDHIKAVEMDAAAQAAKLQALEEAKEAAKAEAAALESALPSADEAAAEVSSGEVVGPEPPTVSAPAARSAP